MATRKDQQKIETHERMLGAASRCFRTHGYEGIGVAGVSEEAGVTSGAFYAHFGSKAAAFEAALSHGLDEVLAALPSFRAQHGAAWLGAFVDYYLSEAHRSDVAGVCAMTSLSPYVQRHEGEVRSIYDTKMQAIVEAFAAGLSGGSSSKRRERAWAALAVLIGALTVARALAGKEPRETLMRAARRAALEAAGATKA